MSILKSTRTGRQDAASFPFEVVIMKKILITTYQQAYLYRGGGEIEVSVLQDQLNKAGFLADLYGPTSKPITEYETVIHFSLTAGSNEFIRQLRYNCKTLVLWPNLWFVNEPEASLIEELQQIVDVFDLIVFKTETERLHFERFFKISNQKIIVVKCGLSGKIVGAVKSHLFKEVYKFQNYILWTGIIEPQKNQLSLIKALSREDIDVVFSGGVRNREYFEECKKAAGENTHFLPEMAFLSEIHISAIMNSRLFVEIPHDFPGISAIEAKYLGCQLLLTDCDWSREVFQDDAFYTDTDDIGKIRAALDVALDPANEKQQKLDYSSHLADEAFRPLLEVLA